MSFKFQELLTKYRKCHLIFNSAIHLFDDDIMNLTTNITDFMTFLRSNWPDVSITPKLHMLEDHVVPFVTQWHVGCGFYGEQGGEAIHKTTNIMKRNYTVRNKRDNLRYIMNNNLSSTNPHASSRRVVKEKRNLKRKQNCS